MADVRAPGAPQKKQRKESKKDPPPPDQLPNILLTPLGIEAQKQRTSKTKTASPAVVAGVPLAKVKAIKRRKSSAIQQTPSGEGPKPQHRAKKRPREEPQVREPRLASLIEEESQNSEEDGSTEADKSPEELASKKQLKKQKKKERSAATKPSVSSSATPGYSRQATLAQTVLAR